MNLMIHILLLVLFSRESYGVLYYLNASEYERMPPLHKLDNYNSCLQEPSDVYCTLNFQLVSDEPNELLHMIKEYSEHSKTHFNHTKLKHGICVTERCHNYIQNKTSVSETTLEGCLNQSFWENYQLKTRIQHYSCYSLSDNEVKTDAGDVVAGIIVFAIIMLNVVGSVYDVWCTSNNHEGKHILLSFSIKRNWKSLISTTHSNDSRLKTLKSLNGIKCILAIGVITGHTFYPFYNMSENIHDLELFHQSIILQSIFNMPLMIQTYLIISAFLMTYNMKWNSEKKPINWRIVPMGIFNRYMRLTPVYALVILLLATWYKFLWVGPLWEESGKEEMLDCKKHWWINLFYLNNYVYNYRCLPPSWSLAADMQLFCCGLILYILLRNSRFKKTILMSLIIFGSIIAGVHTYVRDLDFNLFPSPSSLKDIFVEDPTFNEIYKAGHAYINSYAIGMYLGYFVYETQEHKKIDNRKYRLLRYICSLGVPLLLVFFLSGSTLYRDGPKAPLYMRILCSVCVKPFIGVLTGIIIAGMVLKLENIYRYFLSWNFWIIPSRLTYSVYLIHFPLIMIYMKMQTSLLQMTVYNVFMLSIYITIASFVTAIPMFLLVEAPFSKLPKYLIETPKKETITSNTYNKKTE